MISHQKMHKDLLSINVIISFQVFPLSKLDNRVHSSTADHFLMSNRGINEFYRLPAQSIQHERFGEEG
jgi:hypothetical protein